MPYFLGLPRFLFPSSPEDGVVLGAVLLALVFAVATAVAAVAAVAVAVVVTAEEEEEGG